jgi:hypothetical protein
VHTGDVGFRHSMRRRRRLARAAAGLAIVAVAVGCSSDDDGTAVPDEVVAVLSSDPAVVADSQLPDPAEYATEDGGDGEQVGFVEVDANTSTSAELVAAFEANGLAAEDEWAAAVIANRPYTTGEPSDGQFDHLRAALSDIGLDELTIEAVLASLIITR